MSLEGNLFILKIYGTDSQTQLKLTENLPETKWRAAQEAII